MVIIRVPKTDFYWKLTDYAHINFTADQSGIHTGRFLFRPVILWCCLLLNLFLYIMIK